jgi:methylated-DNA-[protein]-cysteine S-methyltransferase
VQWSAAGLTGIWLPGRLPAAQGEPPSSVLAAVDGIVALLAGERRDLREVVLDESGLDEFRLRVYAATRAVGPGAVATYGEIARTIGSPDAARAVGAALGSNPFPIVVPCHRVLAADGALHGFSAPGGIATKRRMLEIENAPGFTQTALF